MSEAILPTVLYIDDEDLNIIVFKASLKRKYDILIAKSGEEGLDKLRAHPEISAVISDMNMPRMTGLDFVLSTKKEFPSKPCFILSGYCITKEIQDALSNKTILEYFTKPLKADDIENAINSCIGKEE